MVSVPIVPIERDVVELLTFAVLTTISSNLAFESKPALKVEAEANTALVPNSGTTDTVVSVTSPSSKTTFTGIPIAESQKSVIGDDQ